MSIPLISSDQSALTDWDGNAFWPDTFDAVDAEGVIAEEKMITPPPCWDCLMGSWLDE